MKKYTLLFLLLFLLPIGNAKAYFENAICKTNNETGFEACISDDASLIDNDEERELLTNMFELTEYGHVTFYSIDEEYEVTPEKHANNIMHSRYSLGASATMILIDMNERQITVYSDGDIYEYVTDRNAILITDNIYRYATRGEYFQCVNNGFNQIHSILKENVIPQTMIYVNNAILSIISGFLICFAYVWVSSGVSKTKTREYIKYRNLVLNNSRISQRISAEHRVYSPISDSDSSSGGGFSGGGGGGFSGGGGGGGGSSGGGGSHGF